MHCSLFLTLQSKLFGHALLPGITSIVVQKDEIIQEVVVISCSSYHSVSIYVSFSNS